MAQRIFGIIGWLGTALVFAAVAIWVVGSTRTLPASWDTYRYYLALAGLVAMLVYMAGQWREIGTFFGRRQARYGTLAASSVLIVLGILVAINYIGAQQNKRWDLTASRQFSVSDQTVNVLSKLDAPLHMMVFVQNTEFQPYQDRLKEYEYVSKQVTTEYIDPDQKQTLARQNQVQQYGTIVINYKGRTERITSNTEQDITNGIIKVVTGEQRKVYFTQGHGEKNLTSAESDGYNGVSEALKRENYLVEPTVLAQQGAVPDDASVVVVAGPKQDFLAPEIDALKKYLDKQGKVLLALDPPDTPASPPLTNLVALAREWGIEVGNDLVLDVSGMGKLFGASEAYPVAANYPSHAITERFSVMTVYPLSRSVTPVSGGANGRTAQPVVQTSERAWAESNLKAIFSNQPSQPDLAAGDKAGPVTIAAAVSQAPPAPPPADPLKPEPEAPRPEARVVVFGDSDFAGNGVASFAGNRDLFMNTIGWLSQQENLISIRPKEAEDRRLTMTASQQNIIVLSTLFGIPAIVLITGVWSWWRRR
jgi:ABC-type uncharacterized transport system involved in gliding motility auxiliary subunit